MEATITLKDISIEQLTEIFLIAFKSCGKVEIVNNTVNNTYNQVDPQYEEAFDKIDQLEAEIQRLKNNEPINEPKEEYKTKDIRSGELYSRYCIRCNTYFDTKKIGGKICPKCIKPKGKQSYKPIKKNCKFCNEEFVNAVANQKYCDDKCRLAYHKNVQPNEKSNSTERIKNMIDNGNLE